MNNRRNSRNFMLVVDTFSLFERDSFPWLEFAVLLWWLVFYIFDLRGPSVSFTLLL